VGWQRGVYVNVVKGGALKPQKTALQSREKAALKSRKGEAEKRRLKITKAPPSGGALLPVRQ